MKNGERLLGAIELSIDQETMEYERISVPIESNEEMECHEMMVDRLTKLNMFMRFVQGLDSETLNIVMDNVIDEWEDTRDER